jgi:hypothetical protein
VVARCARYAYNNLFKDKNECVIVKLNKHLTYVLSKKKSRHQTYSLGNIHTLYNVPHRIAMMPSEIK